VGEIKSAWELAMEKAERLGKLSPDERSRQKEEEYRSIGQTLVEKYLAGLGLWQLEVELEKYSTDYREGVKAALISRLADALVLGDDERLERIIAGILTVAPDKRENVEAIRSQLTQLFEEYGEVEAEADREMEKSAKDILHQLRISGSAIGEVNPRVVPGCQLLLNALAKPHAETLEGLKKSLAELC